MGIKKGKYSYFFPLKESFVVTGYLESPKESSQCYSHKYVKVPCCHVIAILA